ncbi:MAG: hypothetical protein J7J06_10970 [Methanosarcinales archaeon]|nr:hypothetical protein [Methanosarcinales archaeon]
MITTEETRTIAPAAGATPTKPKQGLPEFDSSHHDRGSACWLRMWRCGGWVISAIDWGLISIFRQLKRGTTCYLIQLSQTEA